MARESILVVDDDATTRKLLRTLLERSGYRVVEAEDAEEGIRLAGEQRPGCIIMDIRLPGMDGLDATRAIKADPTLTGIPVVALTGYAGSDEESRAIDAGCDGFLTKPIDTQGFLEYVGRFLRAARTNTQQDMASDHGHAGRVLIVDDEPSVLELFNMQLEAGGFECITAQGAQEGLRIATSEIPDLILLDVLMPDLSGYEVMRRLKSNLKTMHIPIILVTGLGGVEDKVRGIEAGADEFLTKPVSAAELVVRTRSMLGLARFREQFALRIETEDQQGEESKDTARESHQITILMACTAGAKCEEWEEQLQTEGRRILHAAEEDEIRTILGRQRVDVILVDRPQPCERLKRPGVAGLTQVALVNAEDSPESRIKGIEAGADEVLYQTMDVREVLARITHLTRRKERLDTLQSEHRRALRAATTDGLTGLSNNSYLKRFLEQEVKRSLRRKHPTALLLLDIDDFKAKNDNLGHLAGDRILAQMGRILQESLREIDLASRYGGEEFAVVLPYTDGAGASIVAERMLEAIRSHDFLPDIDSPVARITASLGIAVCPDDATRSLELIDAADSRLYEAKRTGKDRFRGA